MNAVLSGIRLKFPTVHQLSTWEVASLLRGEGEGEVGCVVLLDTRQRAEYDVSHLEGAHHVEYDEVRGAPGHLVARLTELLPSGPSHTTAHVICYCSVGYRSSHVAHTLTQHMHTPPVTVSNMEGSLFKWANEGRPMVDSQGRTTTYCHPYSALWQYLLDHKHRRGLS